MQWRFTRAGRFDQSRIVIGNFAAPTVRAKHRLTRAALSTP